MSRRAQSFQLTNDEIAYVNGYVNNGKRAAPAIKRKQRIYAFEFDARRLPYAHICKCI